MSVALNHTIVNVTDRDGAARHVAELLGLPEPTEFGPFAVVEVANGVSLDFMSQRSAVTPQHYAFLVSEEEFDQIHGRVRASGIDWWADPGHNRPGEINTNDGGRGLYWDGPNHHSLEIITVPYGGG
ncbi:MAG: VOC family protein [Actinomycetia bacterium]|nr:VOC family protein [Actinomycetes bacterium]